MNTMKRLSLCFLLAFYICVSFGQSGYKKQVLLEHFTNSICSSCRDKNPVVFDLVKQYDDNVVHITVHPSIPYASCEFFKANPTENDSRTYYYQVAGTPTVVINGVQQKTNTPLLTANELTTLFPQSSILDLKLITSGTSTKTIQLDYQLANKPASATYRLHVWAIEKVIDKLTANGEPKHYNVFRKALTPIKGRDVSMELGTMLSGSFTYTYPVPVTYSEQQIAFVAFIQNETTKEVLNATESSLSTSSYTVESNINIVISNPVQDNLQVKSLVYPIDLQVVDGNGKSYVKEEFYNGQAISVSHLPNGFYVVEVVVNNRKEIRKLIICR